jgi:hypothetical protein
MSNDAYRLIWYLAVLLAVIGLYLAHGPEALIGYLVALLPRESYRKHDKGVVPLS